MLFGTTAQHHVVFLGAGEVHHRGAIGGAVEHADVHLHVVFQLHAHLVFAIGEDVADARELQDVRGDGRVVAPGHEQIEVAHGFASRAVASLRA